MRHHKMEHQEYSFPHNEIHHQLYIRRNSVQLLPLLDIQIFSLLFTPHLDLRQYAHFDTRRIERFHKSGSFRILKHFFRSCFQLIHSLPMLYHSPIAAFVIIEQFGINKTDLFGMEVPFELINYAYKVSAKYSCGFSNLLDSSIIVNER